MIIRLGLYKTPKHGSSESEYEDAYYPVSIPSETPCPFVCAIGDGATETSFSGLWANLVTEGFCRTPTEEELLTSLTSLRAEWHKITSSKPLPWYAEQKLEKGAFATLLGLVIEPSENENELNWRAHAVGDSCLFHYKTNCEIISFPVSKSSDLNSNPILLCSVAQKGEDNKSLFQKSAGILRSGEKIYLVTDALAGWILNCIETGDRPLEALDQAIKTEGGLIELIDSLREAKSIKNDDYTLLWVEATE